jgi:hypothetical protein
MSIIERVGNHGTTEPAHSSVTTVTNPPAGAPAASAPAAEGHGHRARAWLTIVVAVVASLGQAEYARAHRFVNQIKIPASPWIWGWRTYPIDLSPWLAVAVFDLAVAALLYGGREAFQRWGLSPLPFWSAATAGAVFSIYTNTQHAGGWVTAPASAVLFVLWFLTMYYEYMAWRQSEGNLDGAKPNLLLSRLTIISPRVARQAWKLAGTRSLATGVAHRAAQGQKISPRDLAILVARLYLDVLDDQIVTQLRDAAKNKTEWWQWRLRRALRNAARSRAIMTASDAVDHYMGLPVIERTGIVAGRVTSAAAIEEPRALPAPTPEPAAAPAQPSPRVPGTVLPVSAPPAAAAAPPRRKPSRTDEVPAVPQQTFEDYADKIAQVQRNAGDAWWAGDRLTVDQVQDYGIGNRKHATVVARCLAVLRAQKRADMIKAGQPIPQLAPQGGTE